MIKLFGRQARLRQTEFNGRGRKRSVMLDPGKPFLAGCGDDLSIHDQGGGRVVIKCGNAKNGDHGAKRTKRMKRKLKATYRSDALTYPCPLPDNSHARITAAGILVASVRAAEFHEDFVDDR